MDDSITPVNPETPTPASPTPSPRELTFDFRGNGLEYFKIWIVNILLTIVTLGIYSAWATVRNNRYFYSNLYLDDQNFRYLAEPLTILKGRLIALAAFLVFMMISSISSTLSLVLSLLLIAAIPYFVNKSLEFKMRMSAYKNIQFRFKSSYGEAFMVLFVWPFLGVLTLGILYPMALLKLNKYVVGNSAYGTTPFVFNATFKQYGIIFLTLIGVGLVCLLPLALITNFVPFLAPFSLLITAAVYFGLIVYFISATTNLLYASTLIKDNAFDADVTVPGLAKVMLINTALIIVTLGLYLPAAKVRMAQYIASCVQLHATDSLDNFAAAEQQNISALGEEFGNVFDFGL